jgi:hypothetical protein
MTVLDQILQTTFTKQDLSHRAKILHDYIQGSLFGKQNVLETLSANDQTWLKSLPPDFFKQFNKKNVIKIFEDLDQEIKKISPLIIYLSIESNYELVEQISSWLRKNLTTKTIIEIKYDPLIIGGCALVYKGIYKDYSLRSKVDQNKDKILTEFKSYFK